MAVMMKYVALMCLIAFSAEGARVKRSSTSGLRLGSDCTWVCTIPTSATAAPTNATTPAVEVTTSSITASTSVEETSSSVAASSPTDETSSSVTASSTAEETESSATPETTTSATEESETPTSTTTVAEETTASTATTTVAEETTASTATTTVAEETTTTTTQETTTPTAATTVAEPSEECALIKKTTTFIYWQVISMQFMCETAGKLLNFFKSTSESANGALLFGGQITVSAAAQFLLQLNAVFSPSASIKVKKEFYDWLQEPTSDEQAEAGISKLIKGSGETRTTTFSSVFTLENVLKMFRRSNCGCPKPTTPVSSARHGHGHGKKHSLRHHPKEHQKRHEHQKKHHEHQKKHHENQKKHHEENHHARHHNKKHHGEKKHGGEH